MPPSLVLEKTPAAARTNVVMSFEKKVKKLHLLGMGSHDNVLLEAV
jgi:hypothetical protein